MPSISDSIGRVLGDRYRLVTALGTGASAHVYLADDVSLHRNVAIKVLHPALSADAGFLKRFRAEARAAAALNHPNILQVYDWGEDGDEPYLVLEYLAGGSLRQVLDTGTLLTPEQAIQIGIEATAGLDYAHRRGLVHRDIKPANLLFDSEQRLRIADFGLARALAEAAWTEPQGAVLGTARYAAPEQAEGKSVDGRADVYSLALVLYEAVTGEVPFSSDTTIATLMGRIGALLPENEALGPLNDILVWAAAPDPDERYDAADLAMRLQAAAASLPKPQPLHLAEALPAVVAAVADEQAKARPLRTPPRADGDLTEIGAQPAEPVKPEPEPTPQPEPSNETASPRRRWPWIVAIVALVAVLLGAGTVYAIQQKVFTPSHPVPAVVGLTVAQANQLAAKDHLTVHQSGLSFNIRVPAGAIISQQPSAATAGQSNPSLKQGSAISVVVSKGPPPVTIPSLTGFTSCSDAVAALKDVNLVGVCPTSAQQYSSTVNSGGILGSSPTGTAPYGSTVTIITSKGHAPVAIPSVAGAGSSYATASGSLKAVGFVPAEVTQYSATVQSGQVIGTTPAMSAGPQPYGSTITVNISKGPQPVTVPDVSGDSVKQATSALEALGLTVSRPYGPGDTVLFTDPIAGDSVSPGTEITLYTA